MEGMEGLEIIGHLRCMRGIDPDNDDGHVDPQGTEVEFNLTGGRANESDEGVPLAS